MSIKTVPHRPCSPDPAPCDFCFFPKLRDCRYETIEEVKEAVTKVIDTLTQEDFHGAFQKLLDRYNECIAAKRYYFEGDKSFMCVLSIKVPIRKKSGNLSYTPRQCVWTKAILILNWIVLIRTLWLNWIAWKKKWLWQLNFLFLLNWIDWNRTDYLYENEFGVK